MYVQLIRGKPTICDLLQIRKQNPTISFPENPNMEYMDQFGVFEYVEQVRPFYDELTETVINKLPELAEDGKYYQQWEVIKLSAAQAGENIRNKRNKLLSESDWTQARDLVLPNDSAWTAYRQALRDITLQEGFPFNVEWPVVEN